MRNHHPKLITGETGKRDMFPHIIRLHCYSNPSSRLPNHPGEYYVPETRRK